MTRIFLISTLISLTCFLNVTSQTTQDVTTVDSTSNDYSNKELKGLVLDSDTKKALPYTNIYVLHKDKGAISNELGYFSMDISDLEKTDTVRFQYVGYKTRNITIGQIDTSAIVYLKEEIFNLSEFLVFGSPPDPVSIVKKVLENKDSNYKRTTSKKQAFIRERDISDVDEFKINYKKSTIAELDRDMIALVEEKFPKNFTSYTDFLGHLYFNKNLEDSITFKVDPIRTVSLKEEDIAELEQIETIFENIITETGEDEYWKVKSGVFGEKLEFDDDESETEKDSTNENERRLSYFNSRVKYQLRYSSLDDKDQWEFLHKTGRYEYTLAGGTRVNGEDVYIIDFEPTNSGKFIGRMFISINTYALIRADYEYAPGKKGTNIHLLGIGYTENQFSGSIYFEKGDAHYNLKYFSYKQGAYASFDRNIALMKKRKRKLFDKKLKEIKVGVDISLNLEESIEYLVLDEQEISDKQFAGFKQKKFMEVIYVDQFDDNLWRGFPIIEPTQQMKEYKKQDIIFDE